MISNEEFLERRKSGIGGSDVAAVLGLSKWKTPFQLWQEKTGRAPQKDETEYQHFGHVLEQVVADEFVRRTGKPVQKRNEMFRMKEHPELIANIDRYIVGGGVLECKTANQFTESMWGGSGTDEVPEYYLCQVMHYEHVTGYQEGYLAVLIGGNQYRQYEIPYDRELAEYQAAKCSEFWENYVLRDTPPPVTIDDDLKEIYPGKSGTVAAADETIKRELERYKTVSDDFKSVKDERERLAAEIKLFMKDSEILADGSKILATLKRSKDQTADIVEWEKMARTLLPPDYLSDNIISDFTTRGVIVREGSRLLKVK